jgi:chemotaxis regulatin CheY-phosphate phosphatase CheZ
MGESGIEGIIKKLANIKANLTSEENMIPILADLLEFIQDIIPLMLEVNTFMQDGQNKLPSATENLMQVSRTTESETNKIMDRLDNITRNLIALKKQAETNAGADALIAQIDEMDREITEIFTHFQFQDITNQQLEYVNRILQAIYQKFVELFHKSLKVRARSVFGQDVIEAIEQELQGKNSTRDSRQFALVTSDFVRQNGISQEHIDKYFKAQEKQ